MCEMSWYGSLFDLQSPELALRLTRQTHHELPFQSKVTPTLTLTLAITLTLPIQGSNLTLLMPSVILCQV